MTKRDSTISFPDSLNDQKMGQRGRDFDNAIITEKKLRVTYANKKTKSDNIIKGAGNYFIKYYKPSKPCATNYLVKRFPIIKWVSEYNIKTDAVKDLIAGLTIGIVHIPQGMAYSLMAGLPAINGLYVSFFHLLVYLIFGTSRHLSAGTYAIISLIVLSSLKKYEGELYPKLGEETMTTTPIYENETNSTTETYLRAASSENYLSQNPEEAKVMIAMALSLISGLFLILFGILHIGFVTKYLSDSIVNGFISSAALHVVVSQIDKLLGIKLGENHIMFVMIGDLINIFSHIKSANWITIVISVVSIIVLYLVKTLVNEKYKKKLPFPVPIELFVVIIATVVSYYGEFSEKKVKVIGVLAKGFPSAVLPPTRIFGKLIGDSLTIAIVTFALNISMAKMFAKKYKYEIGPNQELFSYGLGNVISAFFSGFPGCVGLSRCAILEGVGNKTQAYGVYSSIMILLVVLFLGPLFKTLPTACLAAIIVVALKNMVLDVIHVPKIFKKSKIEGLAWVTTYLGVVILDVDIGLYIGIGFSLLLMIFRSQRARTSILGRIPKTKLYECIETFPEANELDGIRIIRYEESVYYANVDNFKYRIVKAVGIDPKDITNQLAKLEKKTKDKRGEEDPTVEGEKYRIKESLSIKHIIIDCSCINYIDSQGVSAILQLYESYKEIGISMYLTYCKPVVIKSFNKYLVHEKIDFDYIFRATHDAVRYLKRSEQNRRISTISETAGHVHLELEQDQGEIRMKSVSKTPSVSSASKPRVFKLDMSYDADSKQEHNQAYNDEGDHDSAALPNSNDDNSTSF